MVGKLRWIGLSDNMGKQQLTDRESNSTQI